MLPAQVSRQGRKQAQAFATQATSTLSANVTSVLQGSFARTTQTRSIQSTYKQKVDMNVLLDTTVLPARPRRSHAQPEPLDQASEAQA